MTTKRKVFILIFLIVGILLSTPVFAGGDQDGGGGGPAVPLYMDWSYPWDGETNVSINPVIQCKYSHNVASYLVKERNATLFSLKKSDGTEIPINVYIADDQLEFEKRQYIYIFPAETLELNATYVVTVEEGVQSRNGMATEEPYSFQFTTGRMTVALVQTASVNEETIPAETPPAATAIPSPEATEPAPVTMGVDEETEESAEACAFQNEPEAENPEAEAVEPDIRPEDIGGDEEEGQAQSTFGISAGVVMLLFLVVAAGGFGFAVISKTGERKSRHMAEEDSREEL